MAEITGERKEKSRESPADSWCSQEDSLVIVRLLHVTSPSGKLAQKELLSESLTSKILACLERFSPGSNGRTPFGIQVALS